MQESTVNTSAQQHTPDAPIDFVITWVDGADPAWRAQRDEWLTKEEVHPWSAWATGELRFRDWGLLPYWFRGVEKFAPWVRKVHFVTWGHVPAWLNLNHPKLNVVRHEDFIPEEYLPTFNSNTIDLNLHRIDGLAEQFTYFNDDMFLTRPVRPKHFFKHGLPRDFAGLAPGFLSSTVIQQAPWNAMLLRKHFDYKHVMSEHPGQWFNPIYGPHVLAKTVTLLPYVELRGMQTNHLSYNLLKRTFSEVWDAEHAALRSACLARFRSFEAYNIWLMQDWQRMKGQFVPINPQVDAFLERLMPNRNNAKRIVREISRGTWRQVTVGDVCTTEENFVFWREVVQQAFWELLPDACSFEVRQ